MDLRKFKNLVEKWVLHQNVKLSGVAVLHDGNQEIWSASLIYDGSGSWPEPKVENIEQARYLCSDGNTVTSEFAFYNLTMVEFIMQPDASAKRWQVQWLFRGFGY